MNPFDENNVINDDEQFQIIDSLFDEEDLEDESRSDFFMENA